MTTEEVSVIDFYEKINPVHGGENLGNFLRNNDLYKSVVDQTSSNPSKFGAISNCNNLFLDTSEHVFYTLVHMTDFGYQNFAVHIHDQLKATIMK